MDTKQLIAQSYSNDKKKRTEEKNRINPQDLYQVIIVTKEYYQLLAAVNFWTAFFFLAFQSNMLTNKTINSKSEWANKNV